ncbi:MAG: phosphotransferase [Acidobacteria bacterium]|nr:phosphotransferase [Acidobacteriota bacterium]
MISVGDALTLVKFGMMKVGKSLEKHVRAGLGNAGRIWLAGLENTIRALESHWHISVTEPFRSVEYNFVAPAKRDSGEDVVLKIAPPWDPVEIFSEAEFLRHCGGKHCVRLLEEERPLRAILIERLYPGRNLFQVFKGREAEMLLPAAEIIAAVSTHATGSEIEASDVDDWFAGMDGFADTDFPAAYAVRALKYYREVTKGRIRYYIHGDLHPENILSTREGFKVIDPKGAVGHVGYDIAVFLNNFAERLLDDAHPNHDALLDHAVQVFASRFRLHPESIRKWAFCQKVMSAWWMYIDMPQVYQGDVEKADVWGV